MLAVLRLIPLAAVVAAACTPKDPTPPRAKYDGKIADELAALASDCRAFGVAEGQPIDKASDLRCTSPDAELTIHLDKSRYLRGLQIKLLAATTDDARLRLDAALTPIIDDHHRVNALSHLDEPVPHGINPIPQLSLEGFLYQVASEPAGGEDTRRRYIVRIRID